MISTIISLLFRERRPDVGATAILRALRPAASRSKWTQWIFKDSWLLLLSVVLVTCIPFPNKVYIEIGKISFILFFYFIWTLSLEIMSKRLSTSTYDSNAFFSIRILVNVIVISLIVNFSSGSKSYFWIFYQLPIFQSVIYFGYFAVLSVATINLVAYWMVSIFVAKRLGAPIDFASLFIQSLFIAIVTFVLYWFINALKEFTNLKDEVTTYEIGNYENPKSN